MSPKMRILYIAGPGDILGTFEYWRKGEEDPSQVAVTYSGQFYDVCSTLEVESYAISSNPQKKFLQDGLFTIENRPLPFPEKSGIFYHLDLIFYQLGLVISALMFKANIVIVSGQSYYFVFSILNKLGVKIIPSLHNVLWYKYITPNRFKKLLLWLDGAFFGKDCSVILSVSKDINEQVRKITDNPSIPIVNFFPTYRREQFAGIEPPVHNKLPFQVLYAGYIRVEKGIFDLLEIAKRFKAEGRSEEIIFNICGDGPALDLLNQKIQEYEVSSSFICYGHCKKPKMQEMYSSSHVVVVPTRTDFNEGWNKVVIESVLAGRPVITSSVCPSLSAVQEAVVEVSPDNVKEYGDAILKLSQNYDFYQEKQRNCEKLQERFYDSSHSWGESLKSILTKLNQEL